jgi:hypothetical protein
MAREPTPPLKPGKMFRGFNPNPPKPDPDFVPPPFGPPPYAEWLWPAGPTPPRGDGK